MSGFRTAIQRVGNIWQMVHDPQKFLTGLSTQSDMVLFPLHKQALLVANPEQAYKVFQDTEHLGVHKLSMRRLREFLGRNIVTTQGAEWREHRDAIQPSLHGAVLKNMARIMTQEAEGIVGSWKRELKGSPQLVDIGKLMAGVTMRIMAKCILGDQLTSEDMTKISDGSRLGLEIVFPQMNMPVVVPRFIPTRANRQLRRARKNLQSVSLRLIEMYRKQKVDSLEGSLIAHLLQSNLPDEVVEANLRAIFIAGHETTSIALTWAWYLLAQHPEQYDSLVQGENVVGLVREVLRLYPPAWITAREVISPVTFGSFALQPGDLIFVFILAIHHSTKWWGEDVLEFRPDRWTVTYTSTSTPGRWLPFGGGPRVCAGANFALTEMKIFMQTFAQAGGRFTMVDPTHVPVPVAGFTRKPKDPLYMKMQFIS